MRNIRVCNQHQKSHPYFIIRILYLKNSFDLNKCFAHLMINFCNIRKMVGFLQQSILNVVSYVYKKYLFNSITWMITKSNPLHKEGMAIKGIAELLNCKKINQNWYEKSMLFFLSSILYVKITSVIYKRYIYIYIYASR